MNISAKTEYACIAVLELAAHHGSGEPIRIRSIAEKHGIPSRFLVQILLQLKGAGFVRSTRGASGGYQLIKPPSEISLLDVMQVIEGQQRGASSSAGSDSVMSRVLQKRWNEVLNAEQEMLAATSFAELVERASNASDNMYYI